MEMTGIKSFPSERAEDRSSTTCAEEFLVHLFISQRIHPSEFLERGKVADPHD